MVTYRVDYRRQGSTLSGIWRLKISGAISDEFQRKSQAVSMAKRLAKRDAEKSKVIVEKQNGSVQNTFTYKN